MSEKQELSDRIKEIIKKDISEKSYKKYFNYGCHSAELEGDILLWHCMDENICTEVKNFYKPFILAACTALDLNVKEIKIDVN
ncbi:MAG: hypothetical protein E7214_01925 [Clostridium sp.]|nr:hypothetical protein [Clostridium sp.]